LAAADVTAVLNSLSISESGYFIPNHTEKRKPSHENFPVNRRSNSTDEDEHGEFGVEVTRRFGVVLRPNLVCVLEESLEFRNGGAPHLPVNRVDEVLVAAPTFAADVFPDIGDYLSRSRGHGVGGHGVAPVEHHPDGFVGLATRHVQFREILDPHRSTSKMNRTRWHRSRFGRMKVGGTAERLSLKRPT
jgi:hypothetical protein